MTFFKHSAVYMLSQALTALMAFAGIAAFTRLLGAEDFGVLSLILAAVALFNAFVGEGPRLAMLRYISAEPTTRPVMFKGFILPGMAAAGVLSFAGWFLCPENIRPFIVAGLCLFSVRLFFQFQASIARGFLKPGVYAALSVLESTSRVGLGILLVLAGYGVTGAIWGAVLGAGIALVCVPGLWTSDLKNFDKGLWRRIFSYALPLSISAVLMWVTHLSDRWLIAYFMGVEKAGLYAAAYDLPFQAMMPLITTLMMAGLPLVMEAYNNKGAGAAKAHLKDIGNITFALFLPAVAGLLMVKKPLVHLFLGEAFRETALLLMPLIAASVLLKAFTNYVSYGCKIADRTNLILWAAAGTAFINFALNIFMIPALGLYGAALSTLAAYITGIALMFVLGRRVFQMPLPDTKVVFVSLLATAFMAVVLNFFNDVTAWYTLFYLTGGGVLLYLAVFLTGCRLLKITVFKNIRA